MNRPQSHGVTEINVLTQRSSVMPSKSIVSWALACSKPSTKRRCASRFDDAGVEIRAADPTARVLQGQLIGEYRVDLMVDDLVLVEVKAIERFNPVFEAQLLTCLRLTGKRIGLLINFNSRLLKDGVKRLIL